MIHQRNLPGYPAPQIIAEAIAAFQTNNLNRTDLGLDSLEQQDIPAIMMIGTTPHFYLIPITSALNQAVTCATFPPIPTTVPRFIPPLTHPDAGFGPLVNRRVLFQYLETFKEIVARWYFVTA